MLPYLPIKGLHLPMYSLMALLGALAFVLITIYIIEQKEKQEKQITNRLLVLSIFGFLFLIFSAFVFNSLFHSIQNKAVTLGGISWLGGVLGVFPFMLVLIHKFSPRIKGEALEYFNLMIPGITLAHAFGRVGCFFAGCCYGKVTNSIFGVRFPVGSLAAEQYPDITGTSLPVMPTQLFEAVFDIILVIIMLSMYSRLKNFFIELFCFSYGIFRFSLEFLRGDDRGSTGIFLTPSQLMSIILIIYGVLVLLYKKDKVFKKLKAKMAYYVEHRNDQISNSDDTIDIKLKKLKQMYEEDLINEDEYLDCKKQLIQHYIE